MLGRKPPPPPPSPPDILQILVDCGQLLADVAQIKGQIASLTATTGTDAQQLSSAIIRLSSQLSDDFDNLAAQITSAFNALNIRLDQIEAELNPILPPTSLQLWSPTVMAIVTAINLVSGGSSDQVNVEGLDVNGNVLTLSPSTITWSMPVGEASPTDITVAVSSDGAGFTFSATAGITVAESPTLQATWTDPAGVASPVLGPTLTVNITPAAVVVATPASLQYNEVSGA
jgi:hypothetical protein